jgi:hypothetical protein
MQLKRKLINWKINPKIIQNAMLSDKKIQKLDENLIGTEDRMVESAIHLVTLDFLL